MKTFLFILLFLLFVGFVILASYGQKILTHWKIIKNSERQISFFDFLKKYINLKINRLSPTQFFEIWKLNPGFEFNSLVEFNLTIIKRIDERIREFNRSRIEYELQMKRFVSHYILAGSLNELFELIGNAAGKEKPLVVKGRFRTTSEKDKVKEVNYLLDYYCKEIKDLPPKTIQEENPEKAKDGKSEKREKTEHEIAVDQLKADLRLDIKDKGIFMSINDSLENLKKYIFRDSCEAMNNALQSGLNIRFRDLELYLQHNVDIRRILELLIRYHNFDKSVEPKDFEKFILLRGDNESILKSLISAKKSGLSFDNKELYEYHLRGGNLSKLLNALIKAHNEDLNFDMQELTKQLSSGRNVEELIEGLVKLQCENIKMALNDLGFFQKQLDINQFVQNLIKAKQVGITFNKVQTLKSYVSNGGDIINLFNVMIKSGQEDLDISIDDCEKLSLSGQEINLLYEALKIKKRANLDVSKEDLLNLQMAGGNMKTYLEVLDFNNRFGLNITPKVLEADVIEGRDVKDIILALNKAVKEGIQADYNTCIAYNRAGLKISDVINWTVDPQVFTIEPFTIVAKDGIETELKANVTVRGKFYQYFNGSRNEVLAARVNEAIIKEVDRFETYHAVLGALGQIADGILMRLNASITKEHFPELDEKEIIQLNEKERKMNSGSAYEILDINVPLISVNNDVLANLKKEIAELENIIAQTKSEERKSLAIALEREAKAKLIEAEAELQQGMAHAFKEGHMNTKELYKKKIFEDEEHYTTKKWEDKKESH